MNVQVIDFPSDPKQDLTPRFRESMTAMLQRAAAHPDACTKLEECLKFAVQKLKECKEIHKPVKK